MAHLALFFRSSSLSDPDSLLFLCVVGMCAGLACFVYGFRLLRRRRLILDTPFSKIRSAAMGMIEVSGLAVGPYTLVAPITARPCYYYRTLVWEWKKQGKEKEWVKVAGECMHVPFFLDDNTGRVLVDPRGADLDIHRDFQEEFCDSFFTTKDPVPESVRRFLANHGINTSNKVKVEESCIKPKNSLFILGTLAENPGLEVTPQPIPETVDLPPASSLAKVLSNSVSFSNAVLGSESDDLSTTQQLTGAGESQQEAFRPHVIQISPANGPLTTLEMTQQQKVAAALLRAGISNPAAWSAAGLETQSVQVMQAEGNSAGEGVSHSNGSGDNSSGFELHPPTVLMKGTNEDTFLISWRSQQEIARSMGWKSTLLIWGGPIVALASLYLLLNVRGLW